MRFAQIATRARLYRHVGHGSQEFNLFRLQLAMAENLCNKRAEGMAENLCNKRAEDTEEDVCNKRTEDTAEDVCNKRAEDTEEDVCNNEEQLWWP